jgi:hypothetical protein
MRRTAMPSTRYPSEDSRSSWRDARSRDRWSNAEAPGAPTVRNRDERASKSSGAPLTTSQRSPSRSISTETRRRSKS